MYQYLKLKDFKDDVREVHYGNDSALRARVGIKALYNDKFYTVANVWNDFNNKTEANIGLDKVEEKYSSTWGEIGLVFKPCQYRRLSVFVSVWRGVGTI